MKTERRHAMILVLDVGNTHIHMGLFTRGRLRAAFNISTDPRRTVDEYAFLIRGVIGDDIAVEGAIISTVVPPICKTLVQALDKSFHVEAMVLDHSTNIGLVNGYLHPEEVGMDRLASAVGGNYFFGAPLLILDFGTAVTLNFISEPETPGGAPVYRGGAIMPGIRLAAQALYTGTSKLPAIELSDPEGVISGTTAESIRSGLIFGYQGAITTLIDQARQEIGGPCKVVATGGDSAWFKEKIPALEAVEPNLTLYGLRQIYGINHGCPLPKP